MATTLIDLIQQTIRSNWASMALSDYHGKNYTYGDIALIIDHYHSLFRQLAIQQGDRIAICGNGSAQWGISFFATITYGAVAVPILTGFTPTQIQDIVKHSDARLLFASAQINSTLDSSELSQLVKILLIEDIQKVSPLQQAPAIDWPSESSPNDVMMLNYTSGTTGFSKGVMLPYRAFLGNYDFFKASLGHQMKAGAPHLSVLPMAHMYGLTLELICPFISGCHITILGRTPSPSILLEAFAEVKPVVFMAVPLVIEKLTKIIVTPLMKNPRVEKALRWPVLRTFARMWLNRKLIHAFGGNLYQVISGGSAINRSVENTLRTVNFPLTEAYGATECAPMITFCDYTKKRHGSCGTGVAGMEIRIDSSDPINQPGEILTRGQNTMLGYYKNPEATQEALDAEGWYHTGDIGVVDADGYVYIKGRKKNMLLGSNGQNIYPEEIEDKLNSMLMVAESIVVQRGNQLVALVHPDYAEANELGLTDENIERIMELNTTDINEIIPAYEHIHHIEIVREEFEKTAKKSLKRYLYK